MSSPPTSSGEQPLTEKQKKNPQFPSLPDDLVVRCLARVSRLHYPTLSLVSKSFRSLLASPELYKVRSLLHRTESCLYVCLRFPPDPNPRWFTLCRRPNRTNKKSTDNLLVPIPSPPFPSARWSSHVVVGSDIYSIDGTINDVSSSNVLILDCRSHTWQQAPSMLMARDHPTANVLDGKIYVAGGCNVPDSSNWIEVFDPKIKTWKPVTSPGAEMCGSDTIVSTEIDGKVYMYGGYKGVAFNPKEGTCEPVDWNMCKGWVWFSSCVIDNVLFYYDDGVFKWFDTNVRLWRSLKGVKGLPKFPSHSRVKLAGYGGKMVVLWDMHYGASGYRERKIWYAEIVLERRSTKEIWGKVELFDAVCKIPESYEFVCVLAAIV
ncbi:F-box/kelch-repeat protein [Cardamine amara subsp. amara]|uniref:F-box/kelch-repeat protein n=1 Tax=Cardamine amara subsp. amara TaxID=228776 RepID=A0ABD1BNF5_CARAN